MKDKRYLLSCRRVWVHRPVFEGPTLKKNVSIDRIGRSGRSGRSGRVRPTSKKKKIQHIARINTTSKDAAQACICIL